MMHSFRYRHGIIHETDERGPKGGRYEVRYQYDREPGRTYPAKSVLAAKQAIGRDANQ